MIERNRERSRFQLRTASNGPAARVQFKRLPRYHTTEHLLELALTMLENARHEQNNDQLPANNWLTNNFALEIIRAKVAANKANAIINV